MPPLLAALLTLLPSTALVLAGCAATTNRSRAAQPSSRPTSTVTSRLPIRVVTFNLRYDNPSDGLQAWPLRRPLVLQTLATLDADVVGFQEVLPGQFAQLRAGMSGYSSTGRSREADPTRGEASPIFFRADRWSIDPAEQGTFWLSEAPDVPGSKSWDSSLPRACTWARLTHAATGQGVYVFNVHLDHRGEVARLRGTLLVLDRIATRTHRDEPALLIGDFNDGPTGPPARAAIEAGMVDCYAALGLPEQGTFHNWTGRTDGTRIDHVFAAPGMTPLRAEIPHVQRNGVHLTDHFPVVVDLRVERSR